MDVNELIDKSRCFDEVHRKEKLLESLNEFPQLKKDLNILLKDQKNAEWVSKVEEEDVFFIIVDDRWKYVDLYHKASIELLLVGKERVPVIKIFIF